MRAEVVAELRAADTGARRDEDRVLARDRSQDEGMPAVVDRVGERDGETARRLDHDEGVVRLDGERGAAEEEREIAHAVCVRRAGRRVDEAAARTAYLPQPELLDVARDGRLDRLVAFLVKRLGDLCLRGELPLLDQTEDRALTLAARG